MQRNQSITRKDSSKRQYKLSSEFRLSCFAAAAAEGKEGKRRGGGDWGKVEKTGIIFHN